MNLAFIGAGNLAWHLAPELENSGHSVKVVSGKSEKNLERLAERLYDPEIRKGLDFSSDNLHAVFITTPDSVIQEIVSEIILPDNCILIHCSASQTLEILDRSACPDTGVFYPLQTFSRGYKTEFADIPIFIEGNSDRTRDILVGIARGLSREVYLLDSNKRRKLHLAATFACNFTNHLLSISKELITEYELDFDFLWPVLKTTIQKAMELGPENSQTGPAVRRDYDTMDYHVELLKDDPDLEEIYGILSKHIIKKIKPST
jgi:predicted short-subunit dehydrogenase-like oxidoreductase (DUF2520 family)